MCDCCIDYEKGWRDDNDTIIYCPKHNAVNDLYELARIVSNEAPWKINPEWQSMACKALAKADGK